MMRLSVTVFTCAMMLAFAPSAFAQYPAGQYQQPPAVSGYPEPYPSPYGDPYLQQQQPMQTAPQPPVIQAAPGVTYDPYGGFQQQMPGQAPTVSVPTARTPAAVVPPATASSMPQQQGVPPMIGQAQMIPGAAPQPLPPMQQPQQLQQQVPNTNGVNVYRVIKNGNTTYVNRRRIIDPNAVQSNAQQPQPGDIIDPAMQQNNMDDLSQQNAASGCHIPAGVIGMHVSALQNMSVSNPVRIIGPNTQVTMDFSPNRTNFIVDESQIVVATRCG